MSEHVYKDGCRVRVVEFEVRGIDKFGDAQSVDHYETKEEALKAVPGILREYPAAVVEKHTSRFPAHLFNEPSVYETIAVFGSNKALENGGWK